MAEETENPEKSLTPKAGLLIREARVAAGVEAADLCASLRISTAALQALESGQYNRLPGEPYVRALLGSIARYLNLDPKKLLDVYNLEMGTAPTEPSVAPYEDVSQVHVLAHRKLFIALLAVLLLALLLILAKVNSSSGKDAAPAAPAPSDSLTVALPATDSIPESTSLRPDSAGKTLDSSAKKSVIADTGHAHAAAAKASPDSAVSKPVTMGQLNTGMSAPNPPAPAEKDSAKSRVKSKVEIKAILDTAVFRVLRSHKPEEVQSLVLGQQVEITHTDTIVVIQRKAKSVEVSIGDTSFIPSRKRFKVIGQKLSYF